MKLSFSIKLLIVFLVTAPVFQLVAQYKPLEESEIVQVRVLVSGKVTNPAGNDYVRVTINGAYENFKFDSTSWTTADEEGIYDVDLNQDYSAAIYIAGDVNDYEVILSSYYADHETRGDGLETVLDGTASGKIKKSDISSNTFDLRLRYHKSSELLMTFGEAAPVIGGSKAEVQIGLGRDTRPGFGAGSIILRPVSFTNNTVTTTDATFRTTGGSVVRTSYGSGSNPRRQAFAPEGLADIQSMSGGFVIKFYKSADVNPVQDSNGLYQPYSGKTPFITYEVTDYDTNSPSDTTTWKYREFKVKRNAGGNIDYLICDGQEYYVSNYNASCGVYEPMRNTTDIIKSWHKTLGQSEVNYERTVYWLYDCDIQQYETHTILKTTNASGTLIDIKEVFKWQDAQNVTEFVKNGTVTVLDRNYAALDTSNPYQKDLSKTGGETRYYRFTKDNIPSSEPNSALGQIKEKRETFLNSSSQLITTYSYWKETSPSVFDDLALLEKVETKKGTQTVSLKEASYAAITFDSKSAIKKTEKNYYADGSGDYYTTISKGYHPGILEDHLKGKKISVEHPDGTKTSYLIQKGYKTWDSMAGKYRFVASANPAHNEVRIVKLHGKKPVGSGITSYDGGTIDGLDMDASFPGTSWGSSTAEEVYYNELGQVSMRFNYVYTGSGFTQLNHRMYTYNEYGQLTKEWDYNGSPIYPNQTFHEITYQNGRKHIETDGQGIEKEYKYDNYDRVKEIIKHGQSGGIPTQVNINTTVTRDAAGRILTESVPNPSSSGYLTKTLTYDTGGRITSITDPASVTTVYTYPSITQTKVTHPNNGTTYTNFYKDGRVSTITGTAQPGITYAYTFVTGGILETKKSYSITNWNKTYQDWMGRAAKTESPSTNNAGNVVHELHYDDSSGQLSKETLMSGSTVLAPATVYEYDSYGRLVRRKRYKVYPSDSLAFFQLAGVRAASSSSPKF